MPRRQPAPATVEDLCAAMERIAPCWTAAEWDNVGLLVGSTAWPLRKALLTIDFTPSVLNEARARGVQAVVSYHPPVFHPTKRLIAGSTAPEQAAAEALARRIAVYSPHTALDCAEGGTNDTLARLCGLVNLRPFARARPRARQAKLVVFVPLPAVEKVARAVFDAGAGRIGDYEMCSYRVAGQGTFFGTESTRPRVGRRGRLERVDEVRLEVIFALDRVDEVVAAVRRSHPYEEPAFDVYALEAIPHPRLGQGRVADVKPAAPLAALARRIVRRIRSRNAMIVGDAGKLIRRAMVCAGAAGILPFETCDEPLGPGDVVITGEIRHHDALRYRRRGLAAIALGHWASERPVLQSLRASLRKALPRVSFTISKADADPFGRA